MGLFDKLKKKKKDADANVDNTVADVVESAATDTSTVTAPKVNLNKIEKINLAKEEVHKVCLSKTVNGVQPLNGLKSAVAFVIDYSGSMGGLYDDGTVQEVVEQIFPMALEFDDNGTMEVWIFEDGYHRLPDLTINNIEGYVEREIMKYSMGGTNYAPVIKDVSKYYKDELDGKTPAYIVFMTDGDNWDKSETTSAIKSASKQPIFWQFVGLGRGPFNYLEELDDMGGRYVDNADFFHVNKASDITYSDLLNEYPEWLTNDKVKKMLK